MIVPDLLVVESLVAWSDVVLLAHLEVLAEVLVAAPPVEHHHTLALVSQALMEVRVAKIVLVTIIRHQLSVRGRIVVIGLGRNIAPVLDAVFFHHFTVLGDCVVLVEHVGQVDVHDSDAVIASEYIGLPVDVTWQVLHGSDGVLKPSPLLGFITRFLSLLNELCEVTVRLSH